MTSFASVKVYLILIVSKYGITENNWTLKQKYYKKTYLIKHVATSSLDDHLLLNLFYKMQIKSTAEKYI